MLDSAISANRPIRRAPRVRRGWAGLGLGVLVLAGLGFSFETMGLRADAREYPGRRIAVNAAGQHLHLYCLGQGNPTVILEGGFGSPALAWSEIQPEAARATRVCAYDRAGLGWSDPGPAPRSAQQIAAELRELLANGGVEGPYVLVGYSLGGLYVRQFASQYPELVAGLVLVESAHEAQFERLSAQAAAARRAAALLRGAELMARFGLIRAAAPFVQGLPAIANLPDGMRRHLPVVASAKAIHGALAENQAVRLSADQMRAARQAKEPWRFPLIVLTARQAPAGLATTWHELQADLVTLAANGQQRFAERSSHDSILFTEPFVVTAAILEAVAAAR